MAKELPIIFSARSSSPLPLAIEQSGAPPIPNKLVTAVTNIIIGKVIPNPVKAKVEFCAKCPMYILSTRLYKTFINCAMVIGIAKLIILYAILFLVKSFCFSCIFLHLHLINLYKKTDKTTI